MKYKYIILVLTLLFSSNIDAQKNFTLYGLNETAQAHYLNPAFKTKAKFYLSLPVAYQSFGVSNSGFKLNDLFQTRATDDSLVLNPNNALNKMAKLNFLTAEMHNEILAFGFKSKENYFSFSLTNHLVSNFTYPSDLFRFAIEGNGKSLLGKRASLDGLGFNLNSYIEYAFGYNRKVNSKLTVGGRFKFLSGIANVDTRKSKLGITTDATTFDLTIDGAAQVNTSGVKPFYETNTATFNPFKSILNFKNFGMAVDLGANYELNEKIAFSASLLDLGAIKWDTENANFVSNEVNFKFEGVDLNQYLNDSTYSFVDAISDTLNKVFDGYENSDSYISGLYTRFYLGSTYKVSKSFTFGATLYNEIIKKHYRPGLILSGNLKVNNWFAATINYSAYARSFANIGFGFSIKGGPFQWYLISDNILAFMAPQGAKNAHLSTGLNILIGPKKDQEAKAKFE
jgi:hypothetical protein